MIRQVSRRDRGSVWVVVMSKSPFTLMEWIADEHSAKPNHTLQYGKLVGLNTREVVVELENGLRVHSQRIGSVVKAA